MQALTQAAFTVAGSAYRSRELTQLRAGRGLVVQLPNRFPVWAALPLNQKIGFDTPTPKHGLPNFVDAVALHKVSSERCNQVIPSAPVFRRSYIRVIPKWVKRVACRQLIRHKADLNEGTHSVGQQPVGDAEMFYGCQSSGRRLSSLSDGNLVIHPIKMA